MKNALSILLVLNSMSAVAFAEEQLTPVTTIVKKSAMATGMGLVGAGGLTTVAGSFVNPEIDLLKVKMASYQAHELQSLIRDSETSRSQYIVAYKNSLTHPSPQSLADLADAENAFQRTSEKLLASKSFDQLAKNSGFRADLKKYVNLSTELAREQKYQQELSVSKNAGSPYLPSNRQLPLTMGRSENVILRELDAQDAKLNEIHIRPAHAKSPETAKASAALRKAKLLKYSQRLGVAGVAAVGVGMLAGTIESIPSTAAINPGEDTAMYRQLTDLDAHTNSSAAAVEDQSAPVATSGQ